MPLATFEPSVRPSPGTQRTFKPRLFEAEFGDGYSLSAPNGMNHIPLQISLRWDALTLSQANFILAFLKARGGFVPFYWTMQGEQEPRKWVCKEWSMSEGPPAKVNATFLENFSNAS